MIVYRELASIESDLGFSAHTLYSLTNNIDAHYRRVSIPKKNGGERQLCVPDEILKSVQRAVSNRILCYEPISSYASAYRPSSSVVKNASVHVGKNRILKLDIYKFFDSIMYSAVKDKVFYPEKYSEPIRILLTMLCYYKESLPQGAPSSPVITNIIMRDFDADVGAWCKRKGITYTRYCDDMTFSGDLEPDEVIPYVKERLRKEGFILNRSKTVSVPSTQRQLVTGVVVNEKPNVSSEYKRELRQQIHYCKKFGVTSHLAHEGAEITSEQYLSSLLGKINFVLQVCPDDKNFSEYRQDVLDLMKKLI